MRIPVMETRSTSFAPYKVTSERASRPFASKIRVAPKKCGRLEGKQLIPATEMAQKIRAAVDARNPSDFAIIARTDARAVEGLDRALERAHFYVEAGADVLFVEAPENEGEIERIAHELGDTPLL